MTRKTKALLMNAFLIPGAGQLYLGRKLSGMILILIIHLFMLLAVTIIMKGAAPAIAEQISTGSLNNALLMSGMQQVAGYGRSLIAAFLLTWGYALVDIARTKTDP